uniref:Uncharacterized protein n=1 Tax=Arundo donax TaxID=35708 RepID=A0A0A8ZBH2_ARUDO
MVVELHINNWNHVDLN